MNKAVKITLNILATIIYVLSFAFLILYDIAINFMDVEYLELFDFLMILIPCILVLAVTLLMHKTVQSKKIKNILKHASLTIFVISYFIFINNHISNRGTKYSITIYYYLISSIFMIPIAIIIPKFINLFKKTIFFEIVLAAFMGLSIVFQVFRINKVVITNYIICFVISSIIYVILYHRNICLRLNDNIISLIDNIFSKMDNEDFDKKFDSKITYIQYVTEKTKSYNTSCSDESYEFIKSNFKNSKHSVIYDNFKVFACSNINNIYAIYLPESEYVIENTYPTSVVSKIKFIYDVAQFKNKRFEKARYINSTEFNEEIINILNRKINNGGYFIDKMMFPIILKKNRNEMTVRYSTDLNANVKEITISKNYTNFNKLYDIIKISNDEYEEYLKYM